MYLTLLVVMDDEELLEVLQASLMNDGYNVVSVKDAIPIVEGKVEPPDLIIADTKIKPMDGVALCKFLQANKKYSGVPLVLISDDLSEYKRIVTCGVLALIAKPLDYAQLRHIINAQLQKVLSD